MRKEKLYRIRDKNTGLFSCGGSFQPSFTSKGKIWRGTGPLKNHLNQVAKIPDNWEIIELEVVENEIGKISARDWYFPHEEKRRQVKVEADIKNKEYQKKHLEEEIKRKTEELKRLKNDGKRTD